MDQFSAHLDRGWELVQRGDARGAELSARRALELDGQSPEAFNLLGYVAALQGDYEDALEAYRQAIALDDTYLEAMLNAAEVYLHPLGEFEEALQLIDQALELVEHDDELLDALLLKFDALLGMGRNEEARALTRRFPAGPYQTPGHALMVGRAYFEVGDTQRAAPLLEEAARQSPPNPEAFYYLGLLRDAQGNTAAATRAFLQALELDAEVPPPPWSLSRETFQQTAENAVAGLDPRLRRFIAGGEIFTAPAPGAEAVADGIDPRTLVLLDQLEGESSEPRVRVFVYQRNVERVAQSVQHVEGEIRAALEHEIGTSLLEGTPEGKPSTLN